MSFGVFSFDGPLYKDINGVYCNTTITNEVLNRYLQYVDKLYLIMRTEILNDSYDKLRLSPIDNSKLEVLELPNFNSPINYLQKNNYKQCIKEVVRKADMFFLRLPSVTSNMVAKICDELGKPYLVEVGGCAWDSFWNHGLLGKLIAPIMFFNEKKTIKNSKFATYVTEKWLQKRYPTKAPSVSASNVYLKDFNSEIIEKRIINYSNGLKISKIGTIAGVDVHYKGQEYVIKALSLLKKKGIILNYELVGRGSSDYLYNIAKKYDVEEQVYFKGLITHDKIWDWLDTIDIYAQPSLQEGLPRAVIEAMNRGCLCIGSTTAGIPELLEDDMIFKNKDIYAIASIIEKLLSETDLRPRILRNFEKSKEYDVDILNQRRNQIFNSYLKSIKQ